MVLEISATPSIFTFKLWDWGRLGLDGLPRPINIGHGSKVIQWERQTEFVRHNLINQVEMIAEETVGGRSGPACMRTSSSRPAVIGSRISCLTIRMEGCKY